MFRSSLALLLVACAGNPPCIVDEALTAEQLKAGCDRANGFEEGGPTQCECLDVSECPFPGSPYFVVGDDDTEYQTAAEARADACIVVAVVDSL